MAHISQIKKMFALEGLLQNQPKQDQELAEKVQTAQKRGFGTIGRRRMPGLLNRMFGIKVGETKAGRIMQKLGLEAQIRRLPKRPAGARNVQKPGLPGKKLKEMGI